MMAMTKKERTEWDEAIADEIEFVHLLDRFGAYNEELSDGFLTEYYLLRLGWRGILN